jgi:tetratricopeptide (TPR) repeat protein
MNRSAKFLAFAMLALSLCATTGCNKLKARDQLNKGVQSYKNAKYEDAIEKFKNAVALDPSLSVAQLYLATAYANQCTPGVETPENQRTCDQAIQSFKDVLEKNPTDLTAAKGIASLYFQMKKFDEAKEYNRKALQIDPKDPESYYSIGVIDWTQAYTPRMEARNKLGLKPDEPLKDKKVCQEIKEKNTPYIDEGMQSLGEALKLRPDYDDAMAYLNLLWREKADVECGDPAARDTDLKTADDWVNKTLEIKKIKAEKQQQQAGGVTLDQPKQ